jgi:tetratricopeptide (TPR) repeat protein
MRRFDDALAATEHALYLNPSFSHAQNYYAAALAFSGRWEEATEAAKRALRLSPPRSVPCADLRLGVARLPYQYGEAIRTAQTAVRLRPDFASAYRVLAAAAGMTGRKELATAALQQLRRTHPNTSRAWIKNHVPLELDTDLVHYLDGFRRAGLA